MNRRIRVKADHAGTGIGKHTNERVDGLNHEMHINWCRDAVVAKRLTHHGANREIGHVVIIHDIEVDPVGAGVQYLLDLLAQTREICRKNRGRNHKRLHELCSVSSFAYVTASAEWARLTRSS